MKKWMIWCFGTVVVTTVASLALIGAAYAQERAPADGPRRLDLAPWLAPGAEIGAAIRDLSPAQATEQKLASASGALIEEVRPDSAAALAGMRAGDIVVEFDGERVRSARQLSRLVQETPPGRAVPATVMRQGQRVQVNVTPDARRGLVDPEMMSRGMERFGRVLDLDVPDVPLPDVDVEVRRRPGRLGIGTMDLPPQLAEYFGVKNGVLVTSVAAGSAGERAGMKAGDVITSVDGEPVTSPDALRRRIDRPDVREMTIGLVRSKAQMTVKATFDAAPMGRRWPV